MMLSLALSPVAKAVGKGLAILIFIGFIYGKGVQAGRANVKALVLKHEAVLIKHGADCNKRIEKLVNQQWAELAKAKNQFMEDFAKRQNELSEVSANMLSKLQDSQRKQERDLNEIERYISSRKDDKSCLLPEKAVRLAR